MRYRHGEVTHLADHGGQPGLINQKRLAGEKRSPLLHFLGILRESSRQRRRCFTWNLRGTSLKRGTYGGRKNCSFKFEESRHCEKIVEILHPTIRKVQRHDRLELLGNHGFARIRVEPRCGLIQQNRIHQLQRTGSHGVAKPTSIRTGMTAAARRADVRSRSPPYARSSRIGSATRCSASKNNPSPSTG